MKAYIFVATIALGLIGVVMGVAGFILKIVQSILPLTTTNILILFGGGTALILVAVIWALISERGWEQPSNYY